jgi:hypothetical protein
MEQRKEPLGVPTHPGSYSAHRPFARGSEQIATIMDIAEHAFHSIRVSGDHEPGAAPRSPAASGLDAPAAEIAAEPTPKKRSQLDVLGDTVVSRRNLDDPIEQPATHALLGELRKAHVDPRPGRRRVELGVVIN